MSKNELYTLGIDIGSTTVKIAILDKDNDVAFSDYERHYANIQETLSDLLGRAVYKFAVKTVPCAIEKALEQAKIPAEEIKYFLLHQANIRIIESVAKKMGRPMEKFPTNLQKCGNISAASVPILLDHVNREGSLSRGDKIVLAGFGAGLTWGAAVLTW